MKALTIWQPWASLKAKGIKLYETRSWATKYRGKILIHAAKKPLAQVEKEIGSEAARDVFGIAAEHLGAEAVASLPTGAALAVGDLIDCHLIDAAFLSSLTPEELKLGDFTLGRYAWEIVNAVEFPDPVPQKGAQGLWAWDACPACRNNTNDFVCRPECSGCDGFSEYLPRNAKRRCAICGKPVDRKHENNPQPVADGICCDECNLKVVIPARIERNRKGGKAL